MAENNFKGFYKVEEDGGTYVVGTFYNPKTNEFFTTCLRDYDYDDRRNDNDELYYMPIDKDANFKYRFAFGVISEGNQVKIVRGRKMVGEVKRVAKIYNFIPETCRGYKNKNAYAVEYLYFDDGTKCASKNCELLFKRETPTRVDYMEVVGK